jgi:hypothetical protein
VHAPAPDPIRRDGESLVMLVGAYGSGKTEVAVNLAILWARAGVSVRLADLDLVNPYFRSREQQRSMEAHGVRVVVPPGKLAGADLPIVLPEVAGLLRPPAGTVSLLDVGGDDVGARVLSSFRPLLEEGAYELWQVVNGSRPFTSDVGGCHRVRAELEAASRLTVTGLVGNTHLIDETDAATVRAGWRLVAQVARESGLPVRALAVAGDLAADPALGALDAPLLRLERRMRPPWSSPGPHGHGDCGPLGAEGAVDGIHPD